MSHSFRDAVAAYLKARPNTWIDGSELAEVGGYYAWRSRVSDARRQLGMTIENRQRKVRIDYGEPDEIHLARDEFYICSEYRYVPKAVPQQPSMFEKSA